MSVPQRKLAGELSNRDVRLSTWYRDWGGPIRRWMSSRTSLRAADLDDLAQEVFMRLLRYSNDTLVENPQGYLFRIAANVASEWRERARNSLPHEPAWLDDLQVDPEREPEISANRALVSKQVRMAVRRLPKRQREVLLLHVNHGLTCKQIADRLSLTTRIVRRDIAHAYCQLRSDLTDLEHLDRLP